MLAERLERLPAFWIAFMLTLTECVGASIRALPVAMAGIGPLGAVIPIAVFGACERAHRRGVGPKRSRAPGAIRYGTAYFGRLVGEHFGRSGVALLNLAVFANAADADGRADRFGSVLYTLAAYSLDVGDPMFAVDRRFWAGSGSTGRLRRRSSSGR